MVFSYGASVTPRQQQWAQEAIEAANYDWSALALDVHFTTVDEPSCPGHKDYMCTQELAPDVLIQIRRHADEAHAPFLQILQDPRRDLEAFYKESILHELGHAVSFYFLSNDTFRQAAAELFVYEAHGPRAGERGGLGSYNSLGDAWEDRIQEAIAEVFKDTFATTTVFENRTNWRIEEPDFAALMLLIGGSDYAFPLTTTITGHVGSLVYWFIDPFGPYTLTEASITYWDGIPGMDPFGDHFPWGISLSENGSGDFSGQFDAVPSLPVGMWASLLSRLFLYSSDPEAPIGFETQLVDGDGRVLRTHTQPGSPWEQVDPDSELYPHYFSVVGPYMDIPLQGQEGTVPPYPYTGPDGFVAPTGIDGGIGRSRGRVIGRS